MGLVRGDGDRRPPDGRDADRGGRWVREPVPEGSLLPFAPSRTETGAQGSQDKHGTDECPGLPSELTSRKTIAGAHALPAGTALRVPDTARGIAQLLRRIGAEPVARILCGPTNRYHRALEVLLAAAGLPPAPVNPRPARRFAQADITRTGAAIAALIAADPAPGRTRPASCKACPASLP